MVLILIMARVESGQVFGEIIDGARQGQNESNLNEIIHTGDQLTTLNKSTTDPKTIGSSPGIELINELRCGEYVQHPARVAGGSSAIAGQFPHQVRFTINGKRSCGGIIISKWHILSAAHCFKFSEYPYMYKGFVGDLTISNKTDRQQEVSFDWIIMHKYYQTWPFSTNDIALLKTKEPMNFQLTRDGLGSINRVCLPDSSSVHYRDREPMIVSGWGEDQHGANPDNLQFVQVPYVDPFRCEMVNENITSDHICAGHYGRDACRGDSGGPLVRLVGGRYELVGIVSYGPHCNAAHDQVGYYTKVANYVDWIEHSMFNRGLFHT